MFAGILSGVGGLVAGGWDAVSNVVDYAGSGVSTLASGFFPAPQVEQVQHLSIQPMGGSGMTYRPVAADAPSFRETAQMAIDNWLGSPYEENLSTTRAGTTSLDHMIQATQNRPGPLDSVGNLVDWLRTGSEQVLGTARSIRTAADELMELFGVTPRETIPGTPRAGSQEGRDETHYNDLRSMGAMVYEAVQGWGSNFVDQMKGLFGIGYTPTQSQPGFAIRHELSPSRGTTIGIAGVIAVLVIVWLLGKK
jgi:hypothetical protein